MSAKPAARRVAVPSSNSRAKGDVLASQPSIAPMTIDEMIRAVQEQLGVTVDGHAGPQTWGAIYAHIVAPNKTRPAPPTPVAPADARSEKIIATLLPQVHPLARALVHKAALNGIRIQIISGLRTYAEQDALYAKGRSVPGIKVTNARGGYSHHNFGIAFDIGVFEGNKYLAASDKYRAVGVLGMELGLEWGGNWKSPVDQSHFQLRPSWARGMTDRAMLAELRNRAAQGMAVFA